MPSGNPAYWFGGTYPWLNSASVHQGRIIKAPQFVTDLALRECHLPKAPPGSVLVAITGQGKTRGTAAVLCIEATINQHLVHITPRGASVSPDYLQMYLSAAYSELRALSDDSGGTKGALTCHDMRHFRVALPPIDEQVRIVELVNHKTTSIERAVHHIRQETDLLLEYRTRLIADVVTGKLDVRDVELPNLEDADIAYDLGDSNFDSNDDQDDLPDAEEVEADDED
ncbi:MAG TPA: hypothetical protein DCL63_10220 [Firmicutes bacterium]|nr:hypothetical protein [Bacillota bacterium]HBK59439.1 hypothetical protein [Bacillota bacterium]